MRNIYQVYIMKIPVYLSGNIKLLNSYKWYPK